MSEHNSLDSILVEVGDFGKYQSFICSLICIVVVMYSAVHIAYVFSAQVLEYRCEIPGCDGTLSSSFEPDWLPHAVPYLDSVPQSCQRYIPRNSSIESYGNCSSELFDTSRTKGCDSYVYKTSEITILNDFRLHCDNNLWKLTMIGTVNNAGQFIGLPLSGIISDRYGRRLVLIMGMVLCVICGVARSFSPDYAWFVALEFLDAMFGAGTFACAFILGVELVGPSKRVLSGTILSSAFAVGEVLAASVAWLVQSWRPLLRILYLPALLIISYFWLIPESIRWNLAKGRITEAQKVLRKLASVNGKSLSEHALEKLSANGINEDERTDPLKKVFKSIPLLLRFINCSFCWITSIFVGYGLTLNSVALAGNSYLNFILACLIEIPANFCCYIVVDRIGRKSSLAGVFLITGVACASFLFIPDDSKWGQLCVYLVGKFGAAAALTVVYIMTTEMFPTPLRHSLMGACSMIGRTGSMVAPQVPLLEQVWTPLPVVLFATMSFAAALLTLLFPETLNTKLPDTIEEAENIGNT